MLLQTQKNAQRDGYLLLEKLHVLNVPRVNNLMRIEKIVLIVLLEVNALIQSQILLLVQVGNIQQLGPLHVLHVLPGNNAQRKQLLHRVQLALILLGVGKLVNLVQQVMAAQLQQHLLYVRMENILQIKVSIYLIFECYSYIKKKIC